MAQRQFFAENAKWGINRINFLRLTEKYCYDIEFISSLKTY